MPTVKWFFALPYLLAVLTTGTANAQTASITDAAPAATPRATLSNGDCVSVDADGEPWSECGFQAWGMNAAGDRILTISTAGSVELWDESGTRLSSIDWQDEPGGASGYPNARVAIVGGLGVAVVHQNQVLVIDLATGAERVRRSLDLMLIDTLMPTADGRLLGAGKSRNWNLVAGEISLADASFTPIARLPLIGATCGFGWSESMGNCAVSKDARVWLRGETISQGGDSAREIDERNETRLLIYDIPVAVTR